MRPILIQQGFTLIEVMVALILFAIGMMGLAKLQLEAHKNIRYSQQRTALAIASSDLIERMRSNLSAVHTNQYNYSSESDGIPVAVSACNYLHNCASSTQLAQYDLREWLLAIDQSIPIINNNGNLNDDIHIQVCRDSTPTTTQPSNPGDGIDCDGLLDQWTIYIDWLELSEANDNLRPQRQTLSFIP